MLINRKNKPGLVRRMDWITFLVTIIVLVLLVGWREYDDGKQAHKDMWGAIHQLQYLHEDGH